MKIEGDLIKSSNNPQGDDLKLLREKFINEYSKKKGWDKNNLSPNQLLEIIEQKEYKNPGLLLG
jgi:hypothetical protein